MGSDTPLKYRKDAHARCDSYQWVASSHDGVPACTSTTLCTSHKQGTWKASTVRRTRRTTSPETEGVSERLERVYNARRGGWGATLRRFKKLTSR